MPVNSQNTDPSSSETSRRVSRDIPEDVAEALDACGGVEAMEGLLPDEEQLSRICAFHRACADPVRLKILFMLSQQPLCVCVIKEILDIADSRLSYHLGVLRKGGLIVGESQGNWIIYSLADAGRACIVCTSVDG